MPYISNLKQDKHDSRDYIFKANAFNLPSEVDLRPYSREIEDQGGLSSCTANASVSVMENVLLREHDDVNLSRLFIYYNSRAYTEQTKNKDEGAYSRDVFKALMESGVCEETDYPYNEKLVNEKPPEDTYNKAKEYLQLKRYERIARQDDVKFYKQMKAALAKGYPVYIGMTLRQPFMQVRGPINTHPTFFNTSNYRNAEVVGGHAMCVVGYSDEHGYWITENSWGEDWGALGYVGIPYGLLDQDFMDIWVMTGFSFKGQALNPVELWTEPEPTPFEGVTSTSDTYYVYRQSPTEQVSYSLPIKFEALGGVAPYTHHSGAIFFKWIGGDTSAPVLSYDWTANPFRQNGGDYIEESAITAHGITDSSFRNQTRQKQLRLVAVDYRSEDDLPAEFNSSTKVLKLPVLHVLGGQRLENLEVGIGDTGIATVSSSLDTHVPLVDASDPFKLKLEIPKLLLDGALVMNVTIVGFTYTYTKHGTQEKQVPA